MCWIGVWSWKRRRGEKERVGSERGSERLSGVKVMRTMMMTARDLYHGKFDDAFFESGAAASDGYPSREPSLIRLSSRAISRSVAVLCLMQL